MSAIFDKQLRDRLKDLRRVLEDPKNSQDALIEISSSYKKDSLKSTYKARAEKEGTSLDEKAIDKLETLASDHAASVVENMLMEGFGKLSKNSKRVFKAKVKSKIAKPDHIYGLRSKSGRFLGVPTLITLLNAALSTYIQGRMGRTVSARYSPFTSGKTYFKNDTGTFANSAQVSDVYLDPHALEEGRRLMSITFGYQTTPYRDVYENPDSSSSYAKYAKPSVLIRESLEAILRDTLHADTFKNKKGLKALTYDYKGDI